MGIQTHREGIVQAKFVNHSCIAKSVLIPATSEATPEDALYYGTY